MGDREEEKVKEVGSASEGEEGAPPIKRRKVRTAEASSTQGLSEAEVSREVPVAGSDPLSWERTPEGRG